MPQKQANKQINKVNWSKALCTLEDVKMRRANALVERAYNALVSVHLAAKELDDNQIVIADTSTFVIKAVHPLQRRKAEEFMKLFNEGYLQLIVKPGAKLQYKDTGGGGGGNDPGDSKYVIAPKMKGKFAQILKAMYDLGMFFFRDGGKADSLEDVAYHVGSAVGERFPDFHQTVNGAYRVNDPYKVFDDLKKKAEDFDLKAPVQ